MNKQLVLILMACLTAWLAVLTYIQVGDTAPELSPTLQSGQAATVAYVHGDSIQAGYEFIAERERALFAAVQQTQMAVERLATPLQEEAQELIDYAGGSDVTQEELQIAQSRLYEIEAQLAQIQNESQSQLVQLENQLQAEVAQRLSEEVAIFAAENGLEVVLNWGLSGEGVLYGAPAFDVTEALLVFMNERFEASAEEQAEEPNNAE
jgi:Skp family chaperone for outer membrane proteins